MNKDRFLLALFIVGLIAAWLLAPDSGFGQKWLESPTATGYADGTRVPYRPVSGTRQSTISVQGSTTVLECKVTAARIPRHDVDLGRTEIVLRPKDSTKILLQETLCEIDSAHP